MRKSLKYLWKQRSCQKPEPGRRYHCGNSVGPAPLPRKAAGALSPKLLGPPMAALSPCSGPAWRSTGLVALPVPRLGLLGSCSLLSPTEITRAPSRVFLYGLPFGMLYRTSRVRTRVWCGGGVCLVVLDGRGHGVRCGHSRLCRVEVGFFLELPDVLLVPDSLIAKPVGHLQWREVGRVKDTKHLTWQSTMPLRCQVQSSKYPCPRPQPLSAGYSS